MTSKVPSAKVMAENLKERAKAKIGKREKEKKATEPRVCAMSFVIKAFVSMETVAVLVTIPRTRDVRLLEL